MTHVHIPRCPASLRTGLGAQHPSCLCCGEQGCSPWHGPRQLSQAVGAAHNPSRNCPQDWDAPSVGLIQKGESRPVTGSRAPEARPPAVISPTEGLRQEPHCSLVQLPPPPTLTRGSLEGDMWDSVRSWMKRQEVQLSSLYSPITS